MRGVVQSLHRYPIKSLRGELVQSARLSARGLAGDRAFAFIDSETGKVASAKQPKCWSAMLSAGARYTSDAIDAGAVTVSFPDGRELTADDPALPAAMEQLVGRAVRLVAAPPEGAMIERVTPEGEADAGNMVEIPVAGAAPKGTLFDYASLHLLSTSSLHALEALHPRGLRSEALRFRPNLVITWEDQGFVESGWTGRALRVGDAQLEIMCATPRCAIPALAHGEGIERDPDLIRTLGKHNRVPVPGFGNLSCLGAYASVTRDGAVRVGDIVELQ